MKISNCLKKEVYNNNTELRNLFNAYNEERGCDGEYCFSLDNYEEFYHFAVRYGIDNALTCKERSNHWVGGYNFDKPWLFPETHSKILELIDTIIDIERVANYLEFYSKWFDKMNTLVCYYETIYVDYKPNQLEKKELQYEVVLQHFTIFFWEFMTKYNFAYVQSEDTLLDIAANLAYNFHEIYKNTQWKTTFKDYMLNFILREVREKSMHFEFIIHREEFEKNMINYLIKLLY